jgi:hypothetical protein
VKGLDFQLLDKVRMELERKEEEALDAYVFLASREPLAQFVVGSALDEPTEGKAAAAAAAPSGKEAKVAKGAEQSEMKTAKGETIRFVGNMGTLAFRRRLHSFAILRLGCTPLRQEHLPSGVVAYRATKRSK